MDVLPSGTLTLLFSDVEGSTSMLTRLGDQWGDALSAQRGDPARRLRDHGGHEMGTEGDSFFVVFTSAQHAVLAAVEAQRGLAGTSGPVTFGSGCGWACTPASPNDTRTATSASTSTAPPAS